MFGKQMRNDPVSVKYILERMDVPLSVPGPNHYGVLWANLTILHNNFQGTDEEWTQFLDHLAFPDHYPNMQQRFLTPLNEVDAYKRLIKSLDEAYQLAP
jgi:hypothetical protein